jgi:hypothetical protein
MLRRLWSLMLTTFGPYPVGKFCRKASAQAGLSAAVFSFGRLDG